MHNTAKNLAPSNAFFEFSQVDNQVEVSAVLPCDLLQKVVDGGKGQIDAIPSSFSTGQTFEYLKNNLVLMNNSGKKLELAKVEKSGRDLDTKMMNLKLVFLNNGVNAKWMINTLFFDASSIHLNFHKFNTEDEDYLITSKKQYRLPIKFKKNNQKIWIIGMTVTFIIIALSVYLLT